LNFNDIEWHHRGTSKYPGEVFFSNPKEIKKEFMNRILFILKFGTIEKKRGVILMEREQNHIKTNLKKN